MSSHRHELCRIEDAERGEIGEVDSLQQRLRGMIAGPQVVEQLAD